jgi:hypothetical protein
MGLVVGAPDGGPVAGGESTAAPPAPASTAAPDASDAGPVADDDPAPPDPSLKLSGPERAKLTSEQAPRPILPGVVAYDPTKLGPIELPPVGLSYVIDVRLVPQTRQLIGQEIITWRNPTNGPVTRIPVHMYLNAFAHERTTWIEGATALRGFDMAKMAEAWEQPFGQTSIKAVARIVGDEQARTPLKHRYIQPDDGNPLDRSLAEVELAEPLAPGEVVVLDLQFEATLPVPIARTGGVPSWFHVAQWFPKIGVWDPPGHRPGETGRWAARQFHGPTEFYADYADFDVAIDIPPGWSIVATGAEGPTRGDGYPSYERHVFRQRAVHDFAFAVSDRMLVDSKPHTLPQGQRLVLNIVVPKGREVDLPGMRLAAERTLTVLGERVGPYPYPTMTVIAPPWSASGSAGMEYPTLVTSIPSDPMFDRWLLHKTRLHEGTITHEIAHNYFYGLIGNDEQREPLLDEGFTEFWGFEVFKDLKAGDDNWEQIAGLPMGNFAVRRRGAGRNTNIIDPARVRPALLFAPGSHGAQIYTRSALLFRTLGQRFGDDIVDRIFSTWFAARRFTHPTVPDFLAHVDAVAPEVAPLIREHYDAASLPDYEVHAVEQRTWVPPAGFVSGADGRALRKWTPEEERPQALPKDAWPELAREPTGAVLVEVRAPGFLGDDGRVIEGSVRRTVLQMVEEPSEATTDGGVRDSVDDEAPGDAQELQESMVELRGSAWRHLPVDVEFTFSDGAVVRDRWDGRSAWRGYRFVRPGTLDKVVIDPEQELQLDATPGNNAWRREPSDERASTLAGFLAQVAQWLIGGWSLWW